MILKPQTSGQPIPPLLKRCAAVLDPLTKTVPGLMEAQYLMAKVKYLAGKARKRERLTKEWKRKKWKRKGKRRKTFFFSRILSSLLFSSGETDAAKSMLAHCLEQDSTFSDAHLLMAQVHTFIPIIFT